MRVLAIGPRVYLGDIYLSLLREGHEVRVHAEDPPAERAFDGLIETVPDWRAQLPGSAATASSCSNAPTAARSRTPCARTAIA